jgi:hypothetical protein
MTENEMLKLVLANQVHILEKIYELEARFDQMANPQSSGLPSDTSSIVRYMNIKNKEIMGELDKLKT